MYNTGSSDANLEPESLVTMTNFFRFEVRFEVFTAMILVMILWVDMLW